MHRQVLEAHIDDHAEGEAEEAKQDADEKQFVAVDGSVEEGDGREIGKFERGFAAGFGLGKGRGGADSKQRGQSQNFCQESVLGEAGESTASLERSGGKPGAHK